MSLTQILLGLQPYTPPKGRLVPRPLVPNTNQWLDSPRRSKHVEETLEQVFNLILGGVNTSDQVAEVIKRTNATVNGYFRQLEAEGRCYRVEYGSSVPIQMFVIK